MPFCHDPIRNRVVRFSQGDVQPVYRDLSKDAAEVFITFKGPQASKKTGRHGTVVWCPDRSSFLICKSAETNVYECDPVSFSVAQQTIAAM